MPSLIRPSSIDAERYLIWLFLRTEKKLVDEIVRKQTSGYVDYAEQAALKRVQGTLKDLEDESFTYVPRMVREAFIKTNKDLYGYSNAEALARISEAQNKAIELLTANLLGTITEAVAQTYESTKELMTIGRLENDPFRTGILSGAARSEALGTSSLTEVTKFVTELETDGITAFIDKAGRHWSLRDYGNMAIRTTKRQAEVSSLLTADDWDLWQIVKIGSTCPLCAVYEGRVYSKSGMNPNYPPLAMAFGKIDPAGGNDLSNTYLNIHPNCLVPGGAVLGEGIVSESRRLYSGEVVRLKTASGNEIAVTPNHPILTDRGFIPADSLVEGDKIIEASGEYARLIGQAPDNIDIPTVVDEKFHSLVQTICGASCRVKGTAEQFHGDGCPDSEVEIVFADRFRANKREAVGNEKIVEKRFPAGKFWVFKLFSDSAAAKVGIGSFLSANSIMSGLGLVNGIEGISEDGKEFSDLRLRTPAGCRNLRVGHSLIMKVKEFLKLLRVGSFVLVRNIGKLFSPNSIRDGNAEVEFCASDGVRGNIEFSSEFSASEPGLVSRIEELFRKDGFIVSELAHKDTSFYEGYVYNFETKYGYYAYNNIVTHNCLHSLVKFTEMGKSDKQLQKIREFSSPITNPTNIDPRTKKERAAYENKVKNRAKLLRDMRQYEAYKAVISKDIPKSFEKFREIKYNNPEQWSIIKQAYRDRYYLQEQLPYLFGGEKAFIPKNAVMGKVRTIAGAGSVKVLRDSPRLSAIYGGKEADWKKRVGTVTSEKYLFDVHWYELDGKQYEAKLKFRKDR